MSIMKLLDVKKLRENIEKCAKFDLDENNVFGSCYAVAQDGKNLYRGFFGHSNNDGKSVDEKTVFRLASMTKPVTGFAALILVDIGLVSLDDPVKKYLPQFDGIRIVDAEGRDLGKAQNDVKILHLLTHTSGLGSIKYVKTSDKDRETLDDTVTRFASAGLDFEPFTRQAYSAVAAFDAMALVIEKVTGRDYGEFLQNEIFLPCGMVDTTFVPSNEQWGRMAAMHAKVLGKSRVGHTDEGCVFENYPAAHNLAGAGLVSTLTDYEKFAAMLLDEGKAGGKALVSEESFKLYATAHVPPHIMNRPESWGLGVRVIASEEYGTLPVGSFGWSGAYGTHFWVDPKNRITAVFMKNSRFDGGSGNNSAVRFEHAVANALM
ncbi:MAG: beta-lactamase family protein [Ruminococcaceae bacterium]|nr:beta-lactamase family protein [Oscillospiraceae bacterium]